MWTPDSTVVMVIHPHEARDDDELTLNVNDEVTVIEKEGGWWRGRLNDREGLFPSSCVLMQHKEQVPSICLFFSKDSIYLLSLSPVVQEKNRPKQPRGVCPLYFDIQYAMQDALFGQFDDHYTVPQFLNTIC